VLVLLGALALTSAPAIAHAVLVASEPSAGERLERAPLIVTLTFDEPVETALGSSACSMQRASRTPSDPLFTRVVILRVLQFA